MQCRDCAKRAKQETTASRPTKLFPLAISAPRLLHHRVDAGDRFRKVSLACPMVSRSAARAVSLALAAIIDELWDFFERISTVYEILLRLQTRYMEWVIEDTNRLQQDSEQRRYTKLADLLGKA